VTDGLIGQKDCVDRQHASDLTGELARQLSTLVRRDVEVAAAERLPTLRRALLDAVTAALVVLSALFAVAAFAVAGGLGAAIAIRAWAAALVVGGLFALLATLAAVVLVRPRAQPREREELFGLLQMLSRKHHLEELQTSRLDARAEAEDEVRQTSAALVRALLDEAAEHQLRALPEVAKREIGKAEADATDLLAETLALLTAPARAGLSALGRLVEAPPPVVRGRANQPMARSDPRG
jgi:hypothetical protein